MTGAENQNRYWILEDGVRLKRWKGGISCVITDTALRPVMLEDADYALLKACDGKTPLAPCDPLYRFELMGIIRRCGCGEAALKPGQAAEYANGYFRAIDWTITERCNYNCLHCFHAADNQRHREEFSREEAVTLLEEAADCGIQGIRLTGGEPTMLPYFRELLEEIHQKGLALFTLITNGSFLDEELLGFLKALHPRAQIMLSYDGIGTHDWLRQHKGSEEQVKKAIRLCKEAGFEVRINMNVNRRNRAVIPDSVRLLADMGVDMIRLIKTTEAPRWQLNAGGDSLTIGEYYAFSADFAAWYRESGLRLPVAIWQSLFLRGDTRVFHALPVKTPARRCREDAHICSAMLNKVALQANGELIPCAPLAGLFTLRGVRMGNVKRDGLRKLLTESPLADSVDLRVKDKRRFGGKCAACRFFESCQGGCPALSMLFGGSLLSPDDYKCAFFEGGWYDRYCETLAGWKNLNPM